MKGSQASSFVLLVTAKCRRRRVLGVGGMILAREYEVLGEKLVPGQFFPTAILTWTALE